MKALHIRWQRHRVTLTNFISPLLCWCIRAHKLQRGFSKIPYLVWCETLGPCRLTKLCLSESAFSLSVRLYKCNTVCNTVYECVSQAAGEVQKACLISLHDHFLCTCVWVCMCHTVCACACVCLYETLCASSVSMRDKLRSPVTSRRPAKRYFWYRLTSTTSFMFFSSETWVS